MSVLQGAWGLGARACILEVPRLEFCFGGAERESFQGFCLVEVNSHLLGFRELEGLEVKDCVPRFESLWLFQLRGWEAEVE